MEREREVWVGSGQEVDAVPPEQGDVAFAKPQHRVDAEPGSAVGVVDRTARQTGSQAGVDEEGVTRLDSDASDRLGSFELGARDLVIGREPGQTMCSSTARVKIPSRIAVMA